MTGVITISTIGTDSGPFNIYSDVDGYVSPFALNISRAELLTGYITNSIPDGTQQVRVVSTGTCLNSLNIIGNLILCYKILPELTYYYTDLIFKENKTYLYGNITSYENGIDTVSSNGILVLNEDLTKNDILATGTGFNSTLYVGTSLIEQSDGKLIATGVFTSYNGTSANRIIRLNPNGEVDTTFVYGTGFNNFTQHPAIDSLGRIIVPGLFTSYNGSSSNRIVRLLTDGTKDTTFSIGSGFNNTVLDILINPDDSMIIVGYFNTYNGIGGLGGIIKLDSTGARDLSFVSGTGFNPYLQNNYRCIARIPGETSFYVGGYFTSYNGTSANYIIKLNEDGTVDGSFTYGTGFNGNLFMIKVIWENKLLIYGNNFTDYNGTTSYNSIILNADGSVFLNFLTNAYNQPFPIGNKLYGAVYGDCLELIYEYTTTTTTTTSP